MIVLFTFDFSMIKSALFCIVPAVFVFFFWNGHWTFTIRWHTSSIQHFFFSMQKTSRTGRRLWSNWFDLKSLHVNVFLIVDTTSFLSLWEIFDLFRFWYMWFECNEFIDRIQAIYKSCWNALGISIVYFENLIEIGIYLLDFPHEWCTLLFRMESNTFR